MDNWLIPVFRPNPACLAHVSNLRKSDTLFPDLSGNACTTSGPQAWDPWAGVESWGWDPSSFPCIGTRQMHRSQSVTLALESHPVRGQLDNISFYRPLVHSVEYTSCLSIFREGWDKASGHSSWTALLKRATRWAGNMQSEKLSQFFCAAVIISTNRLALPELLGYPLLRLILHKITALLCWQMYFFWMPSFSWATEYW